MEVIFCLPGVVCAWQQEGVLDVFEEFSAFLRLYGTKILKP